MRKIQIFIYFGLLAITLQSCKINNAFEALEVYNYFKAKKLFEKKVDNKIVAAPFAIVGSIGVVAQLPNFNKVLKKYDVDYELFTAGEYKRTVTIFGENTDKAKEKFQSDLEETHELFKKHVRQFRPGLNIDAVANGDIWYGQQALDEGLIDAIGTSDDYIAEACNDADVFSVRYELKKTFKDKLGLSISRGVERALTRGLTALQKQYFTK